MENIIDQIKAKADLCIGYYKSPQTNIGNFYLMGAMPATACWVEDGKEELINLMGRVVIVNVKGSLKSVLGKRGKLEEIAQHIEPELVTELLTGMAKSIQSVQEKKKLYGKELTDLRL